MSTITSPTLIIEMLRNGGVYCGDPAPISIYSYIHLITKERLFAVFWKGMYNDIYEAGMVENPILLFHKGDVTEAGHKLLKSYGF